MSNFKFTGRKRYIQKKGFIVLQVEYSIIETTSCYGQIESERVIRWRDATLEDISVFESPVVLATL